MADIFPAKRSDGRVLLTPNTVLIEAGDLLYYSGGAVFPASSQADQGSEQANQQLFARLFAGVSEDRSPASTTTDITVRVDPTVEYEFACPSTTWVVGQLVGASENATNDGLLDQTVESVSDPSEAIGLCVLPATTSTTVRCVLFSRLLTLLGLTSAGSSVLPVNVETLAGTKTLTANDSQYQILDPGGADRTVTLPAEAEGLAFTIINAADADETITVNNDAAAAQGYVRESGRATYISDGTSWFEMSSDADDMVVNTEALAAGKTIAVADQMVHFLDPGGADRNVTMPTEALAATTGPYFIYNAADADETLTVLEDAGSTTLCVLDRGQFAMLMSDGTSWAVFVGNQHGSAVNVQTLAGNLTMNGTSALVQILDPDGSTRNVLLPQEAVAKGRGVYKIVNNATAGVGFAETITVQNDAGAAQKQLRPGEAVEMVSDGTAWHILSETFGNKNQQEAQSTSTGALTLTDSMMPVQRITTDQNAVIVLPAETGLNRAFLIAHVAGAHTCRIDNDAAGVIITDIGNGEAGRVWSDGTNWYGETFQIT